MSTRKLILVRHGKSEHSDYSRDPGLHIRALGVLNQTAKLIGDQIGAPGERAELLIASSEKLRARETASRIASRIADRGFISEIFATKLLNDDSTLGLCGSGNEIGDKFDRLSAYTELMSEINNQPHVFNSEAVVLVTHLPVITAITNVVRPSSADLELGGVTVIDLDS